MQTNETGPRAGFSYHTKAGGRFAAGKSLVMSAKTTTTTKTTTKTTLVFGRQVEIT